MRSRTVDPGSGPGFDFRHSWWVPAPTDRVYDLLADVADYPAWWPQVRWVVRVDDETGHAGCRSFLPFTLSLTLHAERQDRDGGVLEVALSGDLDGSCRWILRPEGEGTRLVFEQSVRPHSALLRVAGRVARPLLEANHAWMMRGARKGLLAWAGRSGQASLAHREHALDRVLDRTIVLGYSKVGYLIRRRRWPADDPRPGALAGKVAVVTGANGGLGRAAARHLAVLGATVHLVVRDETRGGEALTALRAELPEADLRLARCDVSDLGDVRRFAADLATVTGRVDVLVHNAGVMPAERTESADGHELSLATHVLGPVLMTDLLTPLLAGGGRVVLVSSGGMYTQRLAVADPELTRGTYSGSTAYARSKRIQVALAPRLQRRWGADGIDVHVMHPGWADTPGLQTSLPGFRRVMGLLLRDADQGCDTVTWLAATQPAPAGGRFWHDRAPRPTHYRRRTRESESEIDAMWQWVLSATALAR